MGGNLSGSQFRDLSSGEGVAFHAPQKDPSAKPLRKGTKYSGPMDAEEKSIRRSAGARRRKWEGSPEGQARTADATKLMTEHGRSEVQRLNDRHFTPEEQARGLGLPQGSAGGYDKMGVGQIYEHNRWATPTKPGEEFNQPNLPGLEREDEAPHNKRFHELNQHELAQAHRALAAHGTSLEKMTSDYGAQLDQSMVRAAKYGTHPFSQHFYGDTSPPAEGEPLKPAHVLHEGAKALGIPLGVHVAMNAFTSPNTKFTQGSGDNRYYPNDETARSVVRQVQAGVPAKEVVPGQSPRDPAKKNQGYATNTRKAADALEQHYEGKPVSEWKGRITTSRKEGPVDVPEDKQTSPFGPKTGAYHNAWLPGGHDFFVSDVHSGGGGMLPHLDYRKPQKLDANGNPKLTADGKPDLDKSEREKAIEKIPHFHALADEAARRAHYQRGLTSTRQGQAAQWGEEQIQRPDLTKQTEQIEYADPAARRHARATSVFNDRRSDQGSMFS